MSEDAAIYQVTPNPYARASGAFDATLRDPQWMRPALGRPGLVPCAHDAQGAVLVVLQPTRWGMS